jgi:predicted MFS family arabinose efflux permease
VRALALAIAVFGITGSPLLAAIAYSITFVPQMVGSSFLGTLADRLRPRPLLTALYALDAGVGLAIGLGKPHVSVSLILVAAAALVTPLYQGASGRLIADVLTGDDYVKGRALWCSAPLAAQLAGNALAGICVVAVGAPMTIVISAAFHASAVAMIRLGLPDLPSAPSTSETRGSRNWRSMFAISWRVNGQIFRTPSVRTLLLAKWIPPGLVTGAEALMVPYASRHGYSEAAPGVLLACLAVGMMTSNLAFGRITSPILRDRLTLVLPLVAGLPLVALAADLPVPVIGALLVISGIGLAYDLGLELRFVDSVPEDRRGLAFGLRSTGLMTVQGLGPVLAGVVALTLPVGTVIAITGALVAVLGVIMVQRALTVPLSPRPGPKPQRACSCGGSTGPANGSPVLITRGLGRR